MKLLICTQVVDKDHPVLGFFHRWIEEFAKHYETVHVICLQEGKHDLPDNVYIYSLGKEAGQNRFKYIYRFYKYSWLLRKDYDAVFVHMNQEYLLLMGLIWRLISKQIVLWRNHYSGNLITDIACLFPNEICYTSNSSYTKKFKNSHAMPIGIDTELFRPTGEMRTDNVLYVGRISDSKRVKEIVLAFEVFYKSSSYNVQRLTIAGGTMTGDDQVYLDKLKQYVTGKELPVNFTGPVSWSELPKLYSSHKICINLSRPGMFDKVLGEALACGCKVITTNSDIIDIDAQILTVDTDDTTPVVVAEAISTTLKNDNFDANLARNYVINNQSLEKLIIEVCSYFK